MGNSSFRVAVLEQMRRAKRAIVLRDPNASLSEIVSADRAAFSGLRILYASDVSGVPLDHLFGSHREDLPIARIFAGSGLLAFSDEVEQQMLSGHSPLRYVTRTLLDTNFLSRLPQLCAGDDFDHREQMHQTLYFMEKELGRTLDWSYASLELTREATKANNPWPHLKVAAAKFLDEAPAEFRAQIGSCFMLEKYIPQAEDQWRGWISSPDVWHTISRRDFLYAVMLKAFLQSWMGQPVIEGLSKILDYCLDNFAILPLKELYFAWRALQSAAGEGTKLPIFDERALRAPRKETIKRLSALAWDLFIFRWCETLASMLKGNSFELPLVTTLDKGLLHTIRACPLRAILIHDEGRTIESVFDDELNFQHCLTNAMSSATRARIDELERQARTPYISRYALSASIAALEAEVEQLRMK